MEKVLVMMNTYNGEKYLIEQIDSILNQEGVLTDLLIRDDGSKDETISLLKRYVEQFPERFTLIIGSENLGPSGSNRVVIEKAPLSYNYYAFSDQDDVWLKDKVLSAIYALKQLPSNSPRLYYSNLTITDAELTPRFSAYGEKDITDTYAGCLPDFHASCNTFVCDRRAIQLFKENPPSQNVYGDLWYQILCYFVGEVYYDSISHILFRRTGSNASGIREQGGKLLITHLKRLGSMILEPLEGKERMRRQIAVDILNRFGSELSEEKIHVLTVVAEYPDSFKKRMRLIFDPKIKSKSIIRNFHMILRVLCNDF